MVTVLFGAGVFAGSNGSVSNPSSLVTLTGNNSVATAVVLDTHPLMHFTQEQLEEMQAQINASPKYSAPRRLAAQATPTATSASLLSYLPYIPSDRNQGTCGNCWVWASTGLLEIDHNIINSISNRLSVQYFDSKYYSEGNGNACNGGWLSTFVSWYDSDTTPIPWSNTNAYFSDYNWTGGVAPPVMPFSSISTTPYYTLNSLSYSTIETYGVDNATAIANIESAIDSGKAVEYSFFMSDAGWSAFDTFWDNGASTDLFDPSPYPGTDAGHAVIIVGYNTVDPNNPYWLVVNSWGTTTNRTDGTFRLNMSPNYQGIYSGTQLNTFQIIDSSFITGAPTISGVSPSSGSTAGGTPVTITGTNLTGATAVTFGTTAAATFSVVNNTQINATSPAGAVGTVNIVVTNPYGTSVISSADQYTYFVAVPTVSGVSPSSGSTAGGTPVTITGTNLTGATAVTFGTMAAATFSVVNNTQINAMSPAGAIGTVNIMVTNPYGTSVISSADQYTYYPAIPTIGGVSPSGGPATGGTPVIITGTNLTGVTAVTFGTTAAASFSVGSITQITATSPAGAVGTVNITVTNPYGTSAISSADQFTYGPVPTVSGVLPSSGPATGGNSVTITGTNLTGATAVTFGTTAAATFSVVSSTQVTATSPAGAVGTVDITVTTPYGTSAISSADKYTYYPSIPTVSGVSPSSGPATGGTPVTITGTNLSGTMAVRFGNSLAAILAVVSSTQVTATSPPGAVGTVDVTVTTSSGTSTNSSADHYTYVASSLVPTVSGVLPSSGPATGGNSVTITGTNLTGATAVTFGTTAAATFSVVSSTQVTATSPAGLAGTVDVTVTTSSGTSTISSADHYTYVASPSSVNSTTGVYRNGWFYLASSNQNSGGTVNAFTFGTTGDIPIAGNWTVSGKDTVGVYRNGWFYLASSNQNSGGTVNAFTFGTTGDIPIAGDWTGSGKDTVGVYRNGWFYLASSNQNSGGTVNAFTFGTTGDKPVVWSHNGIDTVGVYRNGWFYLASSNQNSGGTVTAFTFGTTGDKPVDGIWS